MSWELVYIISGLAVFPMLIIAIVVSVRVTTVINRYQQVPSASGIKAHELVKRVAATYNLRLYVETADNLTGDHYDPRVKVVRLTPEVYHSSSVAALAIAAHECGHALQDAQNYAPLKLRNLVVRVSNFSSRLLTPLIIISLIASFLTMGWFGAVYLKWILLAFCVIYGLSALVNFVTLPTEYNASRRGKKLLNEMGLCDTPETKQAVNEVLRAAANTYVVAFALSLLYLLRYLSYLMLLRDRN